MRRKFGEGELTMKLRNRATTAKRQMPLRNTKLIKKNSKIERRNRQLEANIVKNQQISYESQDQINHDFQPASDVEPYLSSINEHICKIDAEYLHQMEQKLSLGEVKAEVTLQMRKILLRWLLRVGAKMRILTETIHICAQLIDYVLVFETVAVTRQNFQLLGITSLFVASKYNQIHTYQAEKYLSVCMGLYKIEQLFAMEGLILTCTKFNLQIPTIHQFMSKQLPEIFCDQMKSHILSLSNLVLFDFRLFNRFKKEHISAVIVYFAAKLVNMENISSRDLIKKSGMNEGIFRQSFMLLIQLYKENQAR